MRKTFLSFLLALCSIATFAQDASVQDSLAVTEKAEVRDIPAVQPLTVQETLINPSKKINDAAVVLEVQGGVPPYQFKWSNQSTPLKSHEAVGLTEGIPYTVTVTDNAGTAFTGTYEVAAESIVEFLIRLP
jgi:hypothetical protein